MFSHEVNVKPYILSSKNIKNLGLAVKNMRYLARSKFSRSLAHIILTLYDKSSSSYDMASSLQVKILILSMEAGYLSRV